MPKHRILYIDILKLFTIFLVIWGHAIMHFQPDFKQSIVFRVIYSFHMPLFMMLSGYFATSSMELDIKSFSLKKFRQLLLPCLSWCIVCWLIITSGLIDGEFHLHIKGLFTGWLGLIDNFWFLKSCFICYVLSWLCWRCGRYKIVAMLLVWFLCTLQGHFFLNMMFPSFLLGLFLRKRPLAEKWLSDHMLIPIGLYMILMTATFIIPNSDIYVIKLLIGLFGAISCFLLFKCAIGKMATTPLLVKIAKLGGITLGIYVVQAILLEALLPRYLDLTSLPIAWIVLLMPLLSFLTLTICVFITNTINRSNIMGFLMFGKEYNR